MSQIERADNKLNLILLYQNLAILISVISIGEGVFKKCSRIFW